MGAAAAVAQWPARGAHRGLPAGGQGWR